MRALVADRDASRGPPPGSLHDAVVPVLGHPVRFALVRRDDEDPEGELHDEQVLLRVRGFSLNYRDQGIILSDGSAPGADPLRGVGSEFVAEVVSAGPAVDSLRPGMRVVGDNTYPGRRGPGFMGGVPTNHASRELLRLHQRKLVAVPEGMRDEDAAAFSLGAQTAYSMVRRLQLEPGDRVLVTAATSNTSLFAIQALRAAGAEVFALTSSPAAEARLRALGVQEVVRAGPGGGDVDLRGLARRIDGFHAVVDPFTDVYLPLVVPALRSFARYVTCGFSAAAGLGIPDARSTRPWTAAAPELIARCATVIGNCLGQREDLEVALDEWEAGRLEVPLDSVHSGEAVGPFAERTFNAPGRLGKVVYLYDSPQP